ncbi:MAG: hypothetical protein SGI88_14790 [Candidatus Hydrogenedentes bacterium]|nr:hypothetical protein [Candidatus Hydrogenedentota bacterium]
MKAASLMLALAFLCGACGQSNTGGADAKVTTLGRIEVTAKLLDAGGEFPPNDLYDYAHIMKYEVLTTHRGMLDGKTIYVGHYNPLKPRASAADERSGEVGGNVTRFIAGDVHRMALVSPIDEHFMGAQVNKLPESEKGAIYWALWTNRAS